MNPKEAVYRGESLIETRRSQLTSPPVPVVAHAIITAPYAAPCPEQSVIWPVSETPAPHQSGGKRESCSLLINLLAHHRRAPLAPQTPSEPDPRSVPRWL